MFGLSQGGDNNHKFRTVLPFSKLSFTLSFDKKIHMEVISSRGFSEEVRFLQRRLSLGELQEV